MTPHFGVLVLSRICGDTRLARSAMQLAVQGHYVTGAVPQPLHFNSLAIR